MARTQIADIIVPEIFVKYVTEKTATLSAFWSSGIVSEASSDLGTDLTEGGRTVNMPFWADISGRSQPLSDQSSLTTNKITAKKDVAVMHYRGNAWCTNDLAAQLSGEDPTAAIADLVAAWWARDMQNTVLLTLSGAFGAASSATNVHDISAGVGDAAIISGATFIDAGQKMGDSKDKLVAVAMHSAVEASLAKRDLITTERDSNGKWLFNTFQGKRVVVDDSMPVTGQVYTSYLFGTGAIGYAEGGVLAPTETDRDSLAGEDFLVSRRAFVLHPRGIAWRGAAAGATPTDAEIATASNWDRVYEPKNVRIVQFRHKI